MKMGTVLLLVVGVFLGFPPLSAQDNELDDTSTEERFVEWDKTDHDFDFVKFSEEVTHNFVLTNNGAEPIFLDNVRTTCGCTAPEWSFDPILPGSSASIKITFDSKKSGDFEKKIKVFVNGIRKPEVLLIRGRVGQDPGSKT